MFHCYYCMFWWLWRSIAYASHFICILSMKQQLKKGSSLVPIHKIFCSILISSLSQSGICGTCVFKDPEVMPLCFLLSLETRQQFCLLKGLLGSYNDISCVEAAGNHICNCMSNSCMSLKRDRKT